MPAPITIQRKSLLGRKTAKLGTQYRVFDFEIRSEFDEETRVVEVAFSSPEPVDRMGWIEVLSHKPGAADLDFLNNRAPLCWMHNLEDQRGVVEPGTARLDPDEKGRCKLRFSKTQAGEDLWTDVKDLIKTKISFGYVIEDARLLSYDEVTGLETWLVTKWRPVEVSFVSIPADDTVGMFRSSPDSETAFETNLEVPEELRALINKIRTPENKMPDLTTEEKLEKSDAELRSLQAEKDQATSDEALRALDNKEILVLGKRYEMHEHAAQFISEKRSLSDFKLKIIDVRNKPEPTGSSKLGMDKKELRRFDLFKLVRAMASKSKSAMDEASFELDMSREVQERLGMEPDGCFIPPDVTFADFSTSARVFGHNHPLTVEGFQRAQMAQAMMQRDVTVGGSGGNTVGTDMMGLSFIEVLRNAGKFLPLTTMWSDLVGDVAVPRHSTATLAYWLAESGAPTEGAPVFDQLTLTPKTVGGYLDLSRKLIKQSSIDIQAWAFAELAAIMGLAVDAAGIAGSGAANQPTGFLNTTGIGDISGGANGSIPTWVDIVRIKREVAKDNALLGDPMWFLNSDTIATMETTERAVGTAEFILNADAPRQTMAGFPWIETNQVPNNLTKGTGTDLSAIAFGNPRDAITGLWGVLDVVVDTATFSTAGGLRISAFQDADIAVRHASSFSAKQDAITI